jgi:hypothetical protein
MTWNYGKSNSAGAEIETVYLVFGHLVLEDTHHIKNVSNKSCCA